VVELYSRTAFHGREAKAHRDADDVTINGFIAASHRTAPNGFHSNGHVSLLSRPLAQRSFGVPSGDAEKPLSQQEWSRAQVPSFSVMSPFFGPWEQQWRCRRPEFFLRA
jgi:hypothetical protein